MSNDNTLHSHAILINNIIFLFNGLGGIMSDCGFKNIKNYDESYYRWCVTQDVEK